MFPPSHEQKPTPQLTCLPRTYRMTRGPAAAKTSFAVTARLMMGAPASGPGSQLRTVPIIALRSPTNSSFMVAASHIIQLLPTLVTICTRGVAKAPFGE